MKKLICFVFTLCMAAVVSAEIVPLTKVQRLPDDYYTSIWLSNGIEVEQLLTEQEYKALSLPGAGSPQNKTGNPSAVWLRAFQAARFSTPSMDLEEGNFVEMDGKIVIMFNKFKTGRASFALDKFSDTTNLSLKADESVKSKTGDQVNFSIINGVLETK